MRFRVGTMTSESRPLIPANVAMINGANPHVIIETSDANPLLHGQSRVCGEGSVWRQITNCRLPACAIYHPHPGEHNTEAIECRKAFGSRAVIHRAVGNAAEMMLPEIASQHRAPVEYGSRVTNYRRGGSQHRHIVIVPRGCGSCATCDSAHDASLDGIRTSHCALRETALSSMAPARQHKAARAGIGPAPPPLHLILPAV